MNHFRALSTVRADGRHADSLASLFDAYRVFYKQPSDAAAAGRFVADRLADGEGSVFFLALREGKAVGFTRMFATYSSIATARHWILEDLYVDPASRRFGVAKALMRRAAQHARETQAVAMSLETARDNAPAQSLYESLGYVREREFYKYNLVVDG